MTFQLLAIDYDNTLANRGVVAHDTEQALIEAKQAGLRIVLVTGRIIDDLRRVWSHVALCDLVVGENGSVLYDPAQQTREELGIPPPSHLVEAMTTRNIHFGVGQVMLAIRRTDEQQVRSLIDTMQLDLCVITNKNDAMVLPPGVNKATGLTAALKRLGIAGEQAVCIGDAENDQDLFRVCGYRVAVANALDELKTEADLITRQSYGAGVAEFIREQLPALQSPR